MQLDLFADRTSAGKMWSHQLRLYFSTFAYALIEGLSRLGLQGTPMARAQCGTIRLRLQWIRALIRVSVRYMAIALSPGCTDQDLFEEIYRNLRS